MKETKKLVKSKAFHTNWNRGNRFGLNKSYSRTSTDTLNDINREAKEIATKLGIQVHNTQRPQAKLPEIPEIHINQPSPKYTSTPKQADIRRHKRPNKKIDQRTPMKKYEKRHQPVQGIKKQTIMCFHTIRNSRLLPINNRRFTDSSH